VIADNFGQISQQTTSKMPQRVWQRWRHVGSTRGPVCVQHFLLRR
jgi:hypothetical protein